MSRFPRAPLIRTATAALVISFALFVASVVRAIRITPVEAATSIAGTELARVTSPPPAPAIDLDAVGANGIFRPDRNAMPYRYRMPGESGPNDAQAPEPMKPVVLGTVLATDGSHFATCQLPGGRPTVLHVGDKLGDYTVLAIDRDKVSFKTTAGKTIEITVTRPGT
jgi:hypothetical protein